ASLNKEYNIEHRWILDLTTLSANYLTAQVSLFAFMDDTN
ncbi:10269_t:CDS:1, partial [Funneliformis geosporum]